MGQGSWKIVQHDNPVIKNTTHHDIFRPSQKLLMDPRKLVLAAFWCNMIRQRADHAMQTNHATRAKVLTNRNWECQSGVWSNQNHIHLYSLPKFSIWTDHKPLILIYMTYKTDPLARILIYKNITRISKWYRKDIQGYHYEMIYEVKQMLRTIQMDSGTTFMPTYLVQSQAKSISSLYNAYTQNTQP